MHDQRARVRREGAPGRRLDRGPGLGFRVLAGALRLSRRRQRRYMQARQRWEAAHEAGQIGAPALQTGYAAALAITAHARSAAWRREELQRRRGLWGLWKHRRQPPNLLRLDDRAESMVATLAAGRRGGRAVDRLPRGRTCLRQWRVARGAAASRTRQAHVTVWDSRAEAEGQDQAAVGLASPPYLGLERIRELP